MSRIGKLPVVLPDKIEVKINWNEIDVKWPLGTLNMSYRSEYVTVSMEENTIIVTPKSLEEKLSKALWGTTRANINNMIEWVSKWYKKSLEINWVWYKFELKWDEIILSIWYSHKVTIKIPSFIKVSVDEKLKNVLHFESVDKQKLWEFVSKIRAKKPPEPYKGKWIKYVEEKIRRKAWKTGK